MSYFSNLSWSFVNKGLGRSSKKFADRFAKNRGIGINILFLSIEFSKYLIISLNVITSGPIHSIVSDLISFNIIWKIISVKSEQWMGTNFVFPL